MKLDFKKCILFAWFCFSANYLSADTKIPSLEYSPTIEKIKPNDAFLCVGTKSAGFNWTSNKWDYASFKPSRWLIKKMPKDHESCFLSNETDQEIKSNELQITQLKRCYSIKEFGEKTELGTFLNTAVCYESYRKDMPGGVAIQCANHIFEKFAFTPNDVFILISGNPYVPPINKKQDSIYTETGTCSTM